MWPKKKRRPVAVDLPQNIVRRAKMIPTEDLLGWAQTAVREVDRNLSRLYAHPDPVTADSTYADTLQFTAALHAVMLEIEKRSSIEFGQVR